MSIKITQKSLLPIRRDKQIPTTDSGGGSSGGSSGGGGSSYIMLSGTTYVLGGAFQVSGNTQVLGTLSVYGDICATITSDERLKTNIKNDVEGLSIIKKLKPITFQYNDKYKELNPHKDDRNNFGLIAQQIEKILPEIIYPVYGGFMGVDYVALIPILIKAVQEQQRLIDDLRKDLEYYKNSNIGL
jgi:hypothetical protein